MVTLIKRNLFYVNGFTDFQLLITEIFSKNKYEKVYVSIGSKWNESTYEYKQIYGNTKTRCTNSHLQMIPNFMKDRKERVLLIVLDQFHDKDNRTTNFRIVQRELSDTMDFVFYDNIDHLDVIKTFVQYIYEMIELHQVAPEHFMITNFIRFQRPNTLEYSMEMKTPENIDKILKPTIYAECFYQWFGYQENLYNMVYNYSRYKNMFRFSEILCTIHTLLYSDLLSVENMAYVYEYYKTQTNHLYFEIFLKNVVDISSFFIDETKITFSLMEQST